MEVAQPRVSFTDLQRMPEDGRRIELYDGEVFELPSPIPRHQVVAENIKWLLRDYSQAHGGLSFISPIDIVFSEYDVVQPDVVFFTKSRRHLVDFDKAIRHPPDLVVEVLSPGTTRNDRGRKLAMFARYDVPEYWIADPPLACLEVHSLMSETGAYRVVHTACGDDEVRSPHLAGLTFRTSDLFRMP